MTEPAAPQPPARRPRRATAATVILAALAVVGFYQPPPSLIIHRVAARPIIAEPPPAEPSRGAYGRSGAVTVRFALPGDLVSYPLVVEGDPTALSYQWVPVEESATADSALADAPPELPRALASDSLTAPDEPGFYRLALVRDGMRRIVEGLTLGVMVPFTDKKGAFLGDYRIGTYLGERSARHASEHPVGFVQITPGMADLPVTKHLRLADLMNQDDQLSWPRYAALNARVLDKLELVLERLKAARPDSAHPQLRLDVQSGFRSPDHNREVSRSAPDSRHQYGDAIDVAIDANRDGRFTAADARLVAAAVEKVEHDYPELVGGLGVYTSRRYSHPYVHIDARGTRARWQG